MEDFFLLLLLYTIFKLCWRFLKWAFGFGWRGPFLFATTFIVGPIPTIGYFFYLPFLRVYALFVGSEKKDDDGNPSDEFPFSEGRPTFKPPALWWANQLDVNNANHFEVIDKIVKYNSRRSSHKTSSFPSKSLLNLEFSPIRLLILPPEW